MIGLPALDAFRDAREAQDMAATIEMKTTRPRSVGRELELVRLEHRARRLDAVLRELRRRARYHPAPELIGRAIDGFQLELSEVRDLLQETREAL